MYFLLKCMKCKIFYKVRYEKLENEINTWLEENPNLKIEHVISPGSGAITIFY